MSITIDDELRILNLEKYEKERYVKQQKALAKMPSAIYVTLIADKNYYSHSGRSRFAKRDPYAFHKDKPLLITNPEDVRYFMEIAKRGNMFKVEIVEEYSQEDEEIELIEDDEFLSEIEEQKIKVEAIEKIEKETKLKAKAEAEAIEKAKIAEKKAKDKEVADAKKAEKVLAKEEKKKAKAIAKEKAAALAKAIKKNEGDL